MALLPGGILPGGGVGGGGSLLTVDAGGEAGAVIRRLAAAITAVALPLPDSNPTGGPVELVFAEDAESGVRTVTLSGGSLSEPQIVTFT